MQSKFKVLTFIRLGIYPYEYKICEHKLTAKESFTFITKEEVNVVESTFSKKLVNGLSLVEPASVGYLLEKKYFENLSTYMSLGEVYS